MGDATPLRRAEKVFVACSALLMLGVRLVTWSAARANGRFFFFQADAYYHLRRTTLFLKDFPRWGGIDRYMSFPSGAECPWPPLYDAAAAAVSWIAGLGRPTPAVIEAVATCLPPLLGAATAVPLYLLCRVLAGARAATAATLLFVAMPRHLGYSVLGSGDHHAAEVLLLTTFLYLFLRSVRRGPGDSGSRLPVAAGVALGVSVLVWQGAIVFCLPAAGGVAAWWASRVFRDAPGASPAAEQAPARPALAALGAAVAVASAGRLAYPSETSQTVFDFGFFSWFQPAFLLLVFLVVLALEAARARLAGGTPRRRLLAAGAVLLACPLLALAVPSFRSNVAGGVEFLLKSDPWVRSIAEFRPPYLPEWFLPPYGLDSAALLASLASDILPAAVFSLLLVRGWRRGEPVTAPAVMACSALMFGALSFLQYRWGNAHSVNIAVGAGILFARLRETGARAEEPGGAARCRASFRAARPVLAWGAALLVAYPVVFNFALLAQGALPWQDRICDPTMAWLRNRTSPTSGLYDSRVRPEYSVLCPWDLGHYVQYMAERPTVVNNFGNQLRGDGLSDMVRFWLAADEREMAEICSRRTVRYIVGNDIVPYFDLLLGLPGVDFGSRFFPEQVFPDGTLRRAPNDAFRSLPYSRLYFADGSASARSPGVSRFRLVHESPGDAPGGPGGPAPVKIFEFVPGAIVTGRARPGETVVVSCPLASDCGRPFVYTTFAVADAQGAFSVRFPYATDPGAPSGTRAQGKARAVSGKRAVEFEIPEKAVVEGGTVRVPG